MNSPVLVRSNRTNKIVADSYYILFFYTQWTEITLRGATGTVGTATESSFGKEVAPILRPRSAETSAFQMFPRSQLIAVLLVTLNFITTKVFEELLSFMASVLYLPTYGTAELKFTSLI